MVLDVAFSDSVFGASVSVLTWRLFLGSWSFMIHFFIVLMDSMVVS